MKRIFLSMGCIFMVILCYPQKGVLKQNDSRPTQTIPLTTVENLKINGLTVTPAKHHGLKCIEAFFNDSSNDERFISIPGITFKDGTIEVEVSGIPGKYAPGKNATELAKGFVGLAFRIQNDTTYECVYLRPVNGRSESQLFRNRSVQYTSHPDFPWQRQRKESPGMYETYCDLQPGVWIKMRIEIKGKSAKLFVDDVQQPTLIVNDLKLGADAEGEVGLWVGSWTLARFRNLKISEN